VAQVGQGQASGAATVEKQDEQAKRKPIQLEEVVVTGSRIPTHVNEGAQEVKIYTREKIEQSGRSTVADFLNTLPAASVSITESSIGTQPNYGVTTVQLHGLPVGTTLVLINGRRLETSGSSQAGTAAFFDLNNIPLAAVDRVEVVSEGSSAIYGSDAIAGVVNIILKRNFDGFETNLKYGGASGTDETNASLAWGRRYFYSGVLGLEIMQRYGEGAVFLSAGGYHHHIALNTWESLGGSPPALYHTAIVYPTRGALATALHRVLAAKIPIQGAADHGVSESIYLNDPDENGVELYCDRPKEKWPRTADGKLQMYTLRLDLHALLREAQVGSELDSGPRDL